MTQIMTNDAMGTMIAQRIWLETNPLRLWLDRHEEFSQRFVASSIGVSTNTVNNWIKGINFPNKENFEKIATMTGISNIDDIWESWMAGRPEIHNGE